MNKQMREETKSLDLTHFNDQDDWDNDDLDVNPPEEENLEDDEDIERELGSPIPETVLKPPATPPPAAPVVTAPVEVLDAKTARLQINQWRQNLPMLKAAVQKEIDALNAQRELLNQQEVELREQLNYLNMMDAPLATPSAAKKRGRRPRTEVPPPPIDATPENRTVEIPVTPAPAREQADDKPRKRPRNEGTWKTSMLSAMATMKHPTTGQANTGFLSDIVQKVVLPKEQGGMGYAHTSGNTTSLTSNARVQMSRLETNELVRKNADKSFTVTDKGLKEIGVK